MSGLALVGHQLRFDQKAFWRNPASVGFTVFFPVLLLFIFGSIFGSDTVEIRGTHIDTDTYYVPAIITIVYSVHFPWGRIPEILLVLAIGAASFSTLGIALTAAIPTQDAAAPIVNFILLPLYFLSGVFIPDDQLPSGIIHFADIFPIRHFFLAFFDAYVPGGAHALDWGHLLVVAIWGLGGLLLAIRYFRWTPRSG
jgi:ABC-type polysaccharide/polyol phosphate export permease